MKFYLLLNKFINFTLHNECLFLDRSKVSYPLTHGIVILIQNT